MDSRKTYQPCYICDSGIHVVCFVTWFSTVFICNRITGILLVYFKTCSEHLTANSKYTKYQITLFKKHVGQQKNDQDKTYVIVNVIWYIVTWHWFTKRYDTIVEHIQKLYSTIFSSGNHQFIYNWRREDLVHVHAQTFTNAPRKINLKSGFVKRSPESNVKRIGFGTTYVALWLPLLLLL